MGETIDLVAKRAKLLEEATEITKSARADGADALTDDQQAKVAGMLKEAGEIASVVMAAQKTEDLLGDLATASELNLENGKSDERETGSEQKSGRLQSPGEVFTSSKSYQDLLKRHPGGFSEKIMPQMDAVPMPSLSELKAFADGAKAIVNVGTNTTAGGNAAPMVVNDQRGLLAPLFRPITMLDLITRGNTTSDTIEFFREVARTNAAAPVGEATATGGASGLKPESAVRFERVTAPVKTLATWIPVTRKALADVGQIRTILDAYLMQFLDEVLEDQVLNGDGTGENLIGIRSVASATQAFDTDTLTVSRKALTQIRLNLVQPTGFVFNPVDVEGIDLMQDGNGRYYGSGPFGIGPRTLWGLPVAESAQQPAGEGLLGDFRQAILYDREQATVSVGTIDDQFVRNMLTLLAELRAALAVQRATAFRKLDLTA